MQGETKSEQKLIKLCTNSFLKFWTYPNLHYKDSKGRSKEFCDLLVVFADKIILFSDKSTDTFRKKNKTRKVNVDWGRVYKAQISSSVDQLEGAENHLLRNLSTTKLYLDKQCTKIADIELPKHFTKENIFRVATISGISGYCKHVHGEKSVGSLALDFQLTGEQIHTQPFTIGHPISSEHFVHVWNDDTVSRVLTECDTIQDLINYLASKESFVNSGCYYDHPQSDQFITEVFEKTGKRIEFHGEEDFLLRRKIGTLLPHEPMIPHTAIDGKTILKMLGHSTLSKHEKLLHDNSYQWDDFINRLWSKELLCEVSCNKNILRSFKQAIAHLAYEDRFSRTNIVRNILSFLYLDEPYTYSTSKLRTNHLGLYVFMKIDKDFLRKNPATLKIQNELLEAEACNLLWKTPSYEYVVGLMLEQTEDSKLQFRIPNITVHFKRDKNTKKLANLVRTKPNDIILPE